jgi:catechol 2,3-dioxygenase-like lactoylglutathione lyase family enzyme
MQAERNRRDHEPPAATARMGWRYHHLGVPTATPRSGERYLPHLKMFVCGFERSPFGIEWMRFEPGSPVSELVQTVSHLAFEVDDLEAAVAGRQLLGAVSSPGKGVRVAMFVDDGLPIEVLQFDKPTPDA